MANNLLVKEKEFPLATAGLCDAAAAVVIDLGIMDFKIKDYAPRPMVKVVLLINQTDVATGQPIQIHMLASKVLGTAARPSKLRNLAGALLHPDLIPRELDLNSLIGRQCRLNLIHVTKNGRTYANVDRAFPADPRAPRLSIAGYKRATTAGVFSDDPEIDAKVQRSIQAANDPATEFPGVG